MGVMRAPGPRGRTAARIIDLDELASQRLGIGSRPGGNRRPEPSHQAADVAGLPAGAVTGVSCRGDAAAAGAAGVRADQLPSAMDWLRDTLAPSSDAALVTDRTGRIAWVNAAMARDLGRPGERLVGRLLESCLVPTIGSLTDADELWRELHDGHSVNLVCAGADAFDRVTRARWTLTPWRADSGIVSAVVALRRPLGS